MSSRSALLHFRQRLTGDEPFPHVTDDIKVMGAGRGQQRVGPTHRLLHEYIIPQALPRLGSITECVASRRLARGLDQPISVSSAWRAMPRATAGPFAANMNGNA
jgi:hypothetical protein